MLRRGVMTPSPRGVQINHPAALSPVIYPVAERAVWALQRGSGPIPLFLSIACLALEFFPTEFRQFSDNVNSLSFKPP